MPTNSTPIPIQLTSSQLIEGLAQLETPALEQIHQHIEQILTNRALTSHTDESISSTAEVAAPIPIVETLIPSTLTIDINHINAQQ